MLGQKKNIEEFDGTINISSNIKANKRTIIGKFDLRDILFILVAVVVGIVIASILFAINMIKNLFVDFMVLALFEVPIITIGFMKIHNMHFLDYIKLKEKSDNTSYRSQVVKRKSDKLNEYIITLEILEKENFINDLENVINSIRKYIYFNNLQIKIIKNRIFVSLKLHAKDINLTIYGKKKINDSEIHNTDYKGLFYYLHNNNNIKFISYEDMCLYDLYIRTLRISDKKYKKEQEKVINKLKNKLINSKTQLDIIDKNSTYLKVYKIMLYEVPFNLKFLEDIKEKYDVTVYLTINENLDISKANFLETYITVVSLGSEIKDKTDNLELLFNKYKILYKIINEDKVKDSINFFMENKY